MSRLRLQVHMRPSFRKHGFTLIELLVVMAVLGILTAILLPVYSSIRNKTQSTVCISNLRQIGAAFSTYKIDNKGNLPAVGFPGSSSVGEWFKSDFFTYLSDGIAFNDYPFEKKETSSGVAPFNNSPLFCPACDPEDSIKPYGVNLWLWQSQRSYPINPMPLPDPAKTMLVADKEGHLSYINSPSNMSSNSESKLSDRHNGFTNVLFCDGHVSSIPYREIIEKHHDITDPFWGWGALVRPSGD
ncbi:prepilin-type N-terminal cleavage/methylation domain-containing protein [Puniceicoccus vermicola]|uniref:Prepilin-type N-terminal cleavage/methylation domain-containing protein n=2 Tax=Puniceicoccus vermicola TaxID=388746 RepID=A0A7X1B0M1_9BACT|nr:prepilin-type N-terminal cleavage/methylation domain-containing protein [Puniceicoccus vermicola]